MGETSNLNRSVNIMSRRNLISSKSFLRAWEKFDIPLKFQFFIYRQWSIYYAKKHNFAAENKCLENALSLNPYDYQSLYNKYKCRRELADFESALECANAAKEIQPHSSPACLAVSQCLADVGRFEDAKVELHRGLQTFQGVKRRPLLEKLQLINSCLNDCLSYSWSPFIMKNNDAVRAVVEQDELERNKDVRPMWKIKRDKHECDVLSEVEISENTMSPIKRARRLRRLRVATQNYLGINWKDMFFLKELTKDKNTLHSYSMPTLPEYVKKNYNIASKFIKVLHTSNPLYRRDEEIGINPQIAAKFKEDFLYRVQYQTSRNVRTILRIVRQYKKEKQLTKLKKYVDEIVIDYLQLKSDRVLPWKFEFLNEILNELGLAYLADYLKHKKIHLRSSHELFRLLNLPASKAILPPLKYEFGDRKTYDAINFGQSYEELDKSKIDSLKKILKFCKYNLTKAYILHQIAYCNFENNGYDKCIKFAKKAARVARNVGSSLWTFLCLMLISKVYTVLQKLDPQLENLEICEYYARKLKNPELISFVENLQEIVRLDTASRKSTNVRKASLSSLSRPSLESSEYNKSTLSSTYKY